MRASRVLNSMIVPVRNVKSQRVQCDEIWSFVHAKAKNVPTAKAAPEGAGDIWTWTALDADNKLILSGKVGGWDASYALELMDDVRERLANRVQLTTDGHSAYLGRSRRRSEPISILRNS
jgi:hypothetical protein